MGERYSPLPLVRTKTVTIVTERRTAMKINTDNKVVYTNVGSNKVYILSLEDAVRNGIPNTATVVGTMTKEFSGSLEGGTIVKVSREESDNFYQFWEGLNGWVGFFSTTTLDFAEIIHEADDIEIIYTP